MSSTVKQIIQGIKEEDEDEPWIPMEEKQSEIQLTEDSQTKGLPEEVPLTMQARGASPKLAIVQRMTSLDCDDYHETHLPVESLVETELRKDKAESISADTFEDDDKVLIWVGEQCTPSMLPSDILPDKESMQLMAIKRRWLIGKKIIVVYEHIWKGMRGLVKEVTLDEKALVELSFHSMYHDNKLEIIPLKNLALDLWDSKLPRTAPPAPSTSGLPASEISLSKNGMPLIVPPVPSTSRLSAGETSSPPNDAMQAAIRSAEKDSDKGAYWLIRQEARQLRPMISFRLRHRVGKSHATAWTVKGSLDTQTPQNEILVLVRKFGRAKGNVPATLESLSIHPLIATDINRPVYCLYPAYKNETLGILMGLEGTGSNALCQVKFSGDTVEIYSKFLVRVAH